MISYMLSWPYMLNIHLLLYKGLLGHDEGTGGTHKPDFADVYWVWHMCAVIVWSPVHFMRVDICRHEFEKN